MPGCRWPRTSAASASGRAGASSPGCAPGSSASTPRAGSVGKLAENPESHATSRFNDGRIDPRGRFLLGTIDEPKAGGTAHLYRYDRRGLVALVDGLLTSNGLAFSPDGRSLYHADTPRFTVRRYAYDPETGALADPEPFVTLTPTEADRGRPDGAAVDVEGCYWTALYEGGRIQRYAPDGRLLAEIAVPARCPTMVAFGGPDLRTLYVTSARAGRPAEELAPPAALGRALRARGRGAGPAQPSASTPGFDMSYDTVRYRSLEGRSVVITGGASGIGEEIVKAFVAQGARVSFIDIDCDGGRPRGRRHRRRLPRARPDRYPGAARDLRRIEARRAASMCS